MNKLFKLFYVQNSTLKFLLLTGFIVFVGLFQINAAYGQLVPVGPPDDITWVDTSGQGSGFKQTNFFAALDAASNPGVNTVQISQLDCSLFPYICAYVDMLDSNGVPVTGLTADSFCVSQDGTPVDSFTVQQITDENCITSICFVVDLSGSMNTGARIDSAKSAMHQYVDSMTAFDRMAIVGFASCTTTVIDFTSNKTDLHNAITSLTANGWTALFDGVWAGVNLTIPEVGTKAVIAFTDGLENRSHICTAPPDGRVNDGSYVDDSTMIVNLANGSGIPIYTFNLGNITDTYYNPEAMQAFATGTGGTWSHAFSSEAIDSIYDEIKYKLCSRYLVCYTSSDTINDGDNHEIVICHNDGITCEPCDTGYCQEPYPPEIVRTPPTIDLSSDCHPDSLDFDICAFVTDFDTPVNELTVRLFYKLTGDVSFTSVSMSLIDSASGQFCYTITSSLLDCKELFEYYITASDGITSLSDPAINPQTSPHSITICANALPVITCPANLTIECDESTAPANTGTATATDADGGAPIITYSDSEVAGSCAQEKTITRTWYAVDDCNDTSTCEQIITVDDSVAPVVTCPANLTIGCNDSTDPANTGTATATDNCDPSPVVTYSDSLLSSVLTRTWIATDACGNADSCQQVITINDNPPVISCPANLTIDCSVSTDTVNTGAATATDDCDPSPTITFSDSEVAGACPQEKVVTRTWTATDNNNNSSQCVQTITVEDNNDPVITCPADLTIDCTASSDPANTGSATATDNCDPAPVITYADVVVGDIITRTWTATDACGNTDQCVQTITIEDTTDPVISCPADLTIDCTASTAPANTGTATATDDCDPAPVVTFSDSEVVGACPQEKVITRTWTAIDVDSNSSQCVQTITVEDNTAPVISCPADQSVDCNGSIDPVSTGTATATDDCTATGSIVITYSDNQVGNVITRTWTATDECLNASQCDQILTIEDTTDPVISCPADLTIDCTASTAPANTGTATATDDCDPAPVVTFSDSEAAGACPQEKVITRTWTATDASNNTAQCIQTITVEDNTAPVISCPANLTVDCNGSVDTSATGVATATDDCSAIVDIVITYSDNQVGNVITRTWTATDECNNSDQCSQTITIEDTTDPVITCPADLTIDCTASTAPANTGTATATDDCDPAPVVTFSDSETAGACPQEKVITRTWTATDADNNSSQCIQTITVEDNTGPVISCPTDLSVDCNGSTDTASTGIATATDDCTATGNIVITYSDNQVGNVITRTWTATDECLNASQCNQVITIEDTTDPVITSCPADLTIDCTASTAPANTGTATATDDCDPSPVVTFSDSEVAGACLQEKVITRTWTATDASNNTTQCIQTITVEDNTAPVIAGCPADVTVECDAIPTAPTLTATDDCDPAPVVTYNESEVAGACAQEKVITRTWTAVDACGNSSQCVQVITVEDNTNPVITCPADLTIDCVASSDPANTGSATATENCDPTPAITYADVVAGNVITRTWTATDACGNSDQCVQTITIEDTTAPVITSCPIDLTIDCTASTDPANTGTATATDDCDPSPVITFSDSEVAGACPQEKVITRTWTATDADNNSSQCIQTITVEDNTGPVITCPPDLSVDCNGSTDPASTGTATATDDCTATGNIVITYSDSQVGNVITRTWSAVDECGNDPQCNQIITIEDTTDPVITSCPADLTIDCTASTDPANTGTATATDDCDPAPVISYSDSEVVGACAQEKVITRTWTVTDASSNSTQCIQVITVEDNTAPVIAGCPGNVTVECDAIPTAPTLSATDDCDPAPVVTFDEVSDLSGCGNYTGTITRTWTAEDACGNSSQCVQVITVEDNTDPVITCPADFMSECGEPYDPSVAGTATATDNCDINLAITYVDTAIFYTIDPQFDLLSFDRLWIATDACGNADTCIQVIDVDDTTPPVITCPGDVQLLCSQSTDPDSTGIATATDTCYPVDWIDITYSDQQNGNIITRSWVALDGSNNADTCIQTITIGDGTDPVCSFPNNQTLFQCVPTEVQLPVSATHNAICEVIAGPGVVSGGNWVYTPSGSETANVTIRCTDACGLSCEGSFAIEFDINSAPMVAVDELTGMSPFCGLNGAFEICVPFTYNDVDDNISNIWVTGPISATVNYANGEGYFCFTPPAVDDILTFFVNVEDACGLTNSSSHVRTIDVDEECDTATCIVLEIEDTECLLLGSYASVNVTVNTITEGMGGFDLLLAYDVTAFSFLSAEYGTAASSWEYLTYRNGPFGNCGGPCPSGMLRVVGIADINNGPNHPDPAELYPDGDLLTLFFRITTNQTLAGYTYDLKFFWVDCGDNGVSSISGDTLFLDKVVYNTDNSILWHEFDELNYPEINRIPNVGAPDNCMEGDKTQPRRCVEFINGSICIIHPDSIDGRADLNLNGIAYEIADAVLYTNYFLEGLSAFDINVPGQIAASDVNNDGVTLTVGDLVYLIRVITGDALPIAKLAPFANSTDVNIFGGKLSTESSSDIGAVYATYTVSGEYQLDNHTDLQMQSNIVDGQLHLLLWSGLDELQARVNSGSNDLFTISGDVELNDIQISDYYGNMLDTKVNKIVLPTEFALRQNSPNPFNPSTKIEIDLPIISDWRIDIYNVAGQLVESFSGQNLGTVEVIWNADNVASGVYFYKVIAGEFTQTKKMVLMK